MFDPDWVWNADQWQHMAAGAALVVLMRGPYITESWRESFWGRVGLVAVIGAAYEGLQLFEASQTGMLGQPGYGFGPLDLIADVAGALVVEGIWSLLKH